MKKKKYVYTYVYIYMYIFMYIYVYMYTYIYIYIHIYTHVYRYNKDPCHVTESYTYDWDRARICASHRTHCITLQQTATRCNTLHRTATHSNPLHVTPWYMQHVTCDMTHWHLWHDSIGYTMWLDDMCNMSNLREHTYQKWMGTLNKDTIH